MPSCYLHTALEILLFISFFFGYSTSTSSSEESSVDVDQWLNLSQYSSEATSGGGSSDRSITKAQQRDIRRTSEKVQPLAETEYLTRNPSSQRRMKTSEYASQLEPQDLSIDHGLPHLPGWKQKGQRSRLVRVQTGQKSVKIPKEKRSEEDKRRYALNRKNLRLKKKELGIELTPSQRQAIKMQTQRYWKSIKSNPELHTRFKEKRNARKARRKAFVRSHPELDEIRKQKDRERTRKYRARLKAEGNRKKQESGLSAEGKDASQEL